MDIDIKGFFDNVNHARLIKQLYTIGIMDKRVLAIISKILKAPIKGEGVPSKGTPQGGILSPLLSNVVLNDLDQWIYSQWEGMKTKQSYATQENKHRALKTTNLKQMHIVRYADDFKILTGSHKTASKIFLAVKGYLKDRLKLDISPEKSKVTNLRRNKSDFLGISIKAKKKKKKFVAYSSMIQRKKKYIEESLRQKIKAIRKSRDYKSILDYNGFVLGTHNYYNIAANVNLDLSEIAYRLSKTLYNQLSRMGKYGLPVNPNETYKRLFKGNHKTFCIKGINLFPLADTQWKFHPNFQQDKCNYTEKGRRLLSNTYLHKEIVREIKKMEGMVNYGYNIEYLDNRISKYSMQKGGCSITGKFLLAEQVHCHHITPKHLGGTDVYKNLVIISEEAHRLIHATEKTTIVRYIRELQLDCKQLKKINLYRKKCNLGVIENSVI